MALPVNSNISSLNAQRNLQRSTLGLEKSLQRLSSGLRINRAGDDAAGLAISEGLRAQIRGLNQAVRNSNDGLSLVGTAESAMDSYNEMLQRVRELGIQSANDTNSALNRAALNQEAQQLLSEMQRIATTVSFNGTNLFDGTFTGKQLQVGSEANQTITISTGDLRTNQLGQVAQVSGVAVTTASALAAGDLLINGVDVGTSQSDGVSTSNAAGSALAKANAINAVTSQTGVHAEIVKASFTGPNAIPGGTINGTTEQLTINGINIFTGATVVAANDSAGVLVDAINARSNQTGVVASKDSSNKLVLTAVDGRNMNIVTTGSVADELGLQAANGNISTTIGGSIKLTSADPFTVDGNNEAFAGLTAGTYAKIPSTAINTIDLTSVAGANLAIIQIDNALNEINNRIRASLGAITNRLEHTIQNLQAISENLSASDSRIRDADFAVETANLTKNQILQQAGISVLSQANATTQGALSLLNGQ